MKTKILTAIIAAAMMITIADIFSQQAARLDGKEPTYWLPTTQWLVDAAFSAEK